MAVRVRVEKFSPNERCRLRTLGSLEGADELLQHKNTCWRVHVADLRYKEIALSLEVYS